MAERKAVNKYYPPNWEPKHGSLNKFHRSHPLGGRASKLHSEGILTIRFELPYHVWCLKCGCFIAQGSRFNADKKVVGNYFSTKILSFSFFCAQCHNKIEMRTDPKNQTYIVTEGGKKKTLEFDADDAGTLTVDSIEKRKRMKSDKLFALEHAEEDKKKAREINARIGKMLKMKEDEADSADLNALMRQKLRESKKLDRLQRTKVGIPDSMKLLPSSPADTAIAHGAVFTPQKPLSIQSLVQGSTSAFSTPSFKKPPPKSSLCPELAEPSQKHQGCREIPQTNALSLLNDYPEESESETDPV